LDIDNQLEIKDFNFAKIKEQLEIKLIYEIDLSSQISIKKEKD
jgi:hypothetical protein